MVHDSERREEQYKSVKAEVDADEEIEGNRAAVRWQQIELDLKPANSDDREEKVEPAAKPQGKSARLDDSRPVLQEMMQ